MKGIGLLLLMSILGVNIELAQEVTSKTNQKNSKPAIKFDKTILNLGRIKSNEKDTYWFKFKNTGKKPLILTSVMTSCGCMAPSWPRAPIKSGKTDSIKVLYNTQKEGTFFKSIRVYSNAKNSPVILKLKGQVVAKENE